MSVSVRYACVHCIGDENLTYTLVVMESVTIFSFSDLLVVMESVTIFNFSDLLYKSMWLFSCYQVYVKC